MNTDWHVRAIELESAHCYYYYDDDDDYDYDYAQRAFCPMLGIWVVALNIA